MLYHLIKWAGFPWRAVMLDTRKYFHYIPPLRCIGGQEQETSLVRQNYSSDCEEAVNKQINLELQASYVYLAMSYHFDREDVALEGFHKFFRKASAEEMEHAEMFMKFQNKRGGRIILTGIAEPPVQTWKTGLQALNTALQLEKKVNQSLLDLHKMAQSSGDSQMCDFIETHYLTQQVDDIKRLADYITNIKYAYTDKLGEYLFDRETLKETDQ